MTPTGTLSCRSNQLESTKTPKTIITRITSFINSPNGPIRWYSTHQFANSTNWLFRSYISQFFVSLCWNSASGVWLGEGHPGTQPFVESAIWFGRFFVTNSSIWIYWIAYREQSIYPHKNRDLRSCSWNIDYMLDMMFPFSHLCTHIVNASHLRRKLLSCFKDNSLSQLTYIKSNLPASNPTLPAPNTTYPPSLPVLNLTLLPLNLSLPVLNSNLSASNPTHLLTYLYWTQLTCISLRVQVLEMSCSSILSGGMRPLQFSIRLHEAGSQSSSFY